jgi:hypothetical protein
LTFSKVREVTRVADQLLREKAEQEKAEQEKAGQEKPEQAVPGADQTRDGMPPGSESLPDLDEEALVELAKACTAAQLARTVSGWRAIKGNSRQRRARQRVSWVTQEDGCVHLTAVLPAEEGQAVIAAIQAATDANTDPEPQPGDEIPDDRGTAKDREARLHRSRVEGLVEIANHYLAARPEDRSGEDRTMVVIEVNAATLQDADTQPPRSQGTRRAPFRSRNRRIRARATGSQCRPAGSAVEPRSNPPMPAGLCATAPFWVSLSIRRGCRWPSAGRHAWSPSTNAAL